MGHFTEFARAVELKPEPAVASKLMQIWNEVGVKQGIFTFTMAAVVRRASENRYRGLPARVRPT